MNNYNSQEMIMQKRKKVDEQILTGNINPPVPFATLERRVRKIKQNSINITRQSIDSSFMNNKIKRTSLHSIDPETDTIATNFWPSKPRVPSAVRPNTSNKKVSLDPKIPRPLSQQKKRIRMIKGVITLAKQTPNTNESLAVVFKRELQYFHKLYEELSNVLAAIKLGLQQFQKAVSSYSRQILSPHFSFIDDFIVGKEEKLKKIVRTSRLHQCLSIAYLFLEIAQERMDENESYLVNFLGHCLSNLIFTARVYILKEGMPQYEYHEFQQAIDQFQLESFGHPLSRIDDVLLRMQHNNEIITMMHRRLGKFNPKFEQCIKVYLKASERKKQSCAQCTYEIFEFLAMHIHELELVGVSETLEVAPAPYLKPAEKKYTLIIEPIGILKKDNKYRPFIVQFFKWAVKHFEVILWTWELPYQMQEVSQLLDQFLTGRLYRHHCKIVDQIYTKDLSRLGRDIDKTVIIDYDKRIVPQHEKNTIQCRWRGNAKDNALLVICQILEQMLSSNSSVQDTLVFYAEQIHAIRGY